MRFVYFTNYKKCDCCYSKKEEKKREEVIKNIGVKPILLK